MAYVELQLDPQLIAATRRALSISQKELATSIGRKQNYLSRVERGLVTLTKKEAGVIARELGLIQKRSNQRARR